MSAPDPASAGPEITYPCAKCGEPRTKAQGGTTFTVCDECWPAPPREPEGEEKLIQEAITALHAYCDIRDGHQAQSVGNQSHAILSRLLREAKIAALKWSATQVCRWYDETRCRERACPCVPIQDEVERITKLREAK